MSTVTFLEARQCVIERVRAAPPPPIEEVPLADAAGRVLAEPAAADRDFPALARSVRDGYAVRSADTPGRLRIIGEVRAGESAAQSLAAGEAIEIMTGAPVPSGADAVVMVEHVTRDSDGIFVPRAEGGQFINPQACEAHSGDQLIAAGRRLGYAEIAVLAGIGKSTVRVYRKPQVAILPTGDEVVGIDDTPAPHQVRNSNAYSLAAQAARAGATARLLPIARDERDYTRMLIERGLEADLVLLSGGVSAGKYDIVEPVLSDLGAEFFFDRVLIQPGQPLVFGRVRGKFFFGLPGNPASTMVTFELFARAAVDLLAGQSNTALPLMLARLTAPFHHRTGLTRFLPAELSDDGAEVTPVAWHGSSDIAALARTNAFLVADSDRDHWDAGQLIRILQR